MAVYFKGQRLAAAHGHNIQQAEMNAASKALENSKGNMLGHFQRYCVSHIILYAVFI